MTNNDILRRIRYALDISDPEMLAIFGLAGHNMEQSVLSGLLKKEDEAGYLECSAMQLGIFLDGLILRNRGVQAGASGHPVGGAPAVTNNAILKKLRIALELKEDDMIGIMKLVGVLISKSELTALFRNREHKHFKVCGDQFLRNFLKGLTMRNRHATAM